MGCSGGENRKKGAERTVDEIMADNSETLLKDMKTNIQKAQQTPSKMNSKRPKLGPRTSKLFEFKDKENLESCNQKVNHHIQGIFNNII